MLKYNQFTFELKYDGITFIRKIIFYRITLKLFKPMVMEQGQRFTLRCGTTTLGTGVVTKVLPRLGESDRLNLTEGRKAREKALKRAAAGIPATK